MNTINELENTQLNNIADRFIDTEYLIDANDKDGGYNDYILRRVKNDVNGNPLYRLAQTMGTFKKSNVVRRNYYKKEYYLLQSHNVKESLDKLFKELELNVSDVSEVI